MSLAGQRIAVTGATGFIGGRLAERLVHEERASVRALVRTWSKAAWLCRYPVTMVHGDVRERADLRTLVEGAQVVFHCATGSGAPGGERVDVEGARVLVEEAAAAGARRVVLLSSTAVLGVSPAGSAQRTPAWPYAEHKLAGEAAARAAASAARVELVILRPSWVWGPRSVSFTEAPARAIAAGRFRMVDGGRRRCWGVYVENLVDACLLAAHVPVHDDAPIVITDEGQYAWRDLYVGYARALGVDERLPSIAARGALGALAAAARGGIERALGALPDGPAPLRVRAVRRPLYEALALTARLGAPTAHDLLREGRDVTFDVSAARAALGYRPRVGLDAALAETRVWLHSQGLASGRE